jgi:multiple antibiotic resistance protein
MLDHFIEDLVSFFVVIDPIGTIPVFIAVTMGLGAKKRKTIALKSIMYAFLILLFFVLLGETILEQMSIPLPAFQIAGGLVLLLFSLTMIFGPSKPESEMGLKDTNVDICVFPLAVPSIASPGAMMASVMMTDKNRYNIEEQMITVLAMVIILIIALLLLFFSERIQKLIGVAGASIVSRVMGLILASLAVSSVLEGLLTS